MQHGNTSGQRFERAAIALLTIVFTIVACSDTSNNAVPGSLGSAGSTGTGGDGPIGPAQELGSGCTCAAGGPPGPALATFVLLLAIARARRRWRG